MIKPNNIPGLKIWLDADDVSTINNGRISDDDSNAFGTTMSKLYRNRQIVSKIVDKVQGYEFNNYSTQLGPSYIFGGINGKNVIHFSYYPPVFYSPAALLSFPTFSISENSLISQGLTSLSTGTYSLFYVYRPSDIRGVTASKDMWAFTMWDGDLIPTITSTTSLSLVYPNRGLKNSGIGYINYRNGWPNCTYVTFSQNGDIIYHESKNNSLIPDTTLLDPFPRNFQRVKNGRFYQYGKTQIGVVRSSQNLKKYKSIRSDFSYEDDFSTRSGSRLSESIPLNNPTMVIGSYWPGQNGIGFTISKTSTEIYSPFEGYFCEFLFFDRVLSDAESNTIENYLSNKWVNQVEPTIYPTESLALCLDPSRKDCFDGVGPRVFDVSDSRIIGTMIAPVTHSFGTYSGVFITSDMAFRMFVGIQTSGFQLSPDRRLGFYEADGMTAHVWVMPRYSDGEWFNIPGRTSSTYPNQRGAYHINLLSTSQAGVFTLNISKYTVQQGLPIGEGWGTASYDPTTNPTYWGLIWEPWYIYYQAGGPVSGTFSAIPQDLRFQNFKWNLISASFDRTPAQNGNGQGYRTRVYMNGVLVSTRTDGPAYFNATNWTDYASLGFRLGGNGGYSWYTGTPTVGMKGYYGLSCIYNRVFTPTDIQDFYDRTKVRYS